LSTPALEAVVLLEELEERGVVVRATPAGSLRCKPKSVITEEDAKRIKANKAELLEVLGSANSQNLSSPHS